MRATKVLKAVKRNFLRVVAPVYRPGARQKVLMFHTGRSGSKVLWGMLNAHPSVYWAGELLAMHRRPAYADKPGFHYKDYLRRCEFNTRRAVYGVEVKPLDLMQLNIPVSDFLEHMRSAGYTKTIILERQNLLRKHISLLTARQAGEFHVSMESKKTYHKITLDCSTLLSVLGHAMRELQELQEKLTGEDALHLIYETDILGDPRVAYARVCRFLGVDVPDVAPRLQRINTKPLTDIVSNFDEVTHTLQGSAYAWMLTD